MPFAGNSKLGHDFCFPRVGFGASNCSLVEIIFVGDSWTSLAITGTYSYTENKLAHFHIWKLSLHFSMITVTGLKTSKLEKGFSLHAKEIGPGPGHTVVIWTFTFHKISGFVRVNLKGNFKQLYRPKVSIFWSENSDLLSSFSFRPEELFEIGLQNNPYKAWYFVKCKCPNSYSVHLPSVGCNMTSEYPCTHLAESLMSLLAPLFSLLLNSRSSLIFNKFSKP